MYIYRVHFKFRFNEQYCHQQVFKFKLIILWIVLIFFSTYKLVLKKKKVRHKVKGKSTWFYKIFWGFFLSAFFGISRHSLFFKHHAGQNDFNFQHFQKFTKYRSGKPANNLPEPLPIVSVLHGPGLYSLWTEFMIFRIKCIEFFLDSDLFENSCNCGLCFKISMSYASAALTFTNYIVLCIHLFSVKMYCKYLKG